MYGVGPNRNLSPFFQGMKISKTTHVAESIGSNLSVVYANQVAITHGGKMYLTSAMVDGLVVDGVISSDINGIKWAYLLVGTFNPNAEAFIEHDGNTYKIM